MMRPSLTVFAHLKAQIWNQRKLDFPRNALYLGTRRPVSRLGYYEVQEWVQPSGKGGPGGIVAGESAEVAGL
jgi:hypothetical protein